MSKNKAPEPILKAAVLCDQAIKEVGTNKWSLIGTWDTISVQSKPTDGKPALQPQLALYFKLGGCVGEYTWEVSLLHFGEQISALGDLSGEFTSQDRLQHVEFALNLKMFPITRLGQHAFRLIVDGKILTDVMFQVRLQDNPQGENQ